MIHSYNQIMTKVGRSATQRWTVVALSLESLLKSNSI